MAFLTLQVNVIYFFSILVSICGVTFTKPSFLGGSITAYCNLASSLICGQMERNAAAGRTFGSIPIATPPPVSSTAQHTKSLTSSFQQRGRGQGVGMDSGSYHEDNNSNIAYADAKPTEYTEALPLKSSAGHNVMTSAQGEGSPRILQLYVIACGPAQIMTKVATRSIEAVICSVWLYINWLLLACDSEHSWIA